LFGLLIQLIHHDPLSFVQLIFSRYEIFLVDGMVSSDLNVAAVQVQLRDVDTTQVPRVQDVELRFLLGGIFFMDCASENTRGGFVD